MLQFIPENEIPVPDHILSPNGELLSKPYLVKSFTSHIENRAGKRLPEKDLRRIYYHLYLKNFVGEGSAHYKISVHPDVTHGDANSIMQYKKSFHRNTVVSTALVTVGFAWYFALSKQGRIRMRGSPALCFTAIATAPMLTLMATIYGQYAWMDSKARQWGLIEKYKLNELKDLALRYGRELKAYDIDVKKR